MKTIVLASIMLAVAAPALAQSQRPFDPRTYQRQVVGEPTQILVLASPHLSGAPEGWDPAVLAPLLDRLAAFAPTVITIEGLSGESVAALWQYREIYPEMATTYGGRIMTIAAMGSAGTGLDMAQAEAEARRLLAAWPDQPTPAQRRRLAAVFATAGNPHSALVQWWRLDAAEQRAEDSVTPALVEQLNAYATRRNENHLIGARLAVRLGLEQIYPIDDHGSDDAMAPFGAYYEAFTSQPWFQQILSDRRFAPLREASQNLRTPQQALDTYRMLNRPETGRLDADMQWLSMINRESPNHAGRARVAEWETRNLRMAANVREIAATHPGERILVITGSAHKAWLDAYLSMMSDVEIVDMGRVLR